MAATDGELLSAIDYLATLLKDLPQRNTLLAPDGGVEKHHSASAHKTKLKIFGNDPIRFVNLDAEDQVQHIRHKNAFVESIKQQANAKFFNLPVMQTRLKLEGDVRCVLTNSKQCLKVWPALYRFWTSLNVLIPAVLIMSELLKGRSDSLGRPYGIAIRAEYLRDESEELQDDDEARKSKQPGGNTKASKQGKDVKGSSSKDKPTASAAEDTSSDKQWVDFAIMLTAGGQEICPLVIYEVKVSAMTYELLTHLMEVASAERNDRTGLGTPHQFMGKRT
jgi:hypothetical protein